MEMNKEVSEIQSQGEATRQKRQPRAIQRQTPMMQAWSRQGWGGVGLETGGGVLEQGGMGMPGGALQRQRKGWHHGHSPPHSTPRSRRCRPSPVTMLQAPSSSWAATTAPSTTWVSSSRHPSCLRASPEGGRGGEGLGYLEQTHSILPVHPRCAEIPPAHEGQ